MALSVEINSSNLLWIPLIFDITCWSHLFKGAQEHFKKVCFIARLHFYTMMWLLLLTKNKWYFSAKCWEFYYSKLDLKEVRRIVSVYSCKIGQTLDKYIGGWNVECWWFSLLCFVAWGGLIKIAETTTHSYCFQLAFVWIAWPHE